MNIAYFSNQFAAAEGHGITRYSRELLSAIRENFPHTNVTPIAAWSNIETGILAKLQQETSLQLLPWGRKLTPLTWTFFNSPKLESWIDSPIDLVHALALGYPVATNKPYVVTIHDLGPLTHPEYFNKKGNWIMNRSLKQAVKSADKFICVSESTAAEFEGYVDQNVSDRIAIVPEGVSKQFLMPPADLEIETVQNLVTEGIPFILSAGKISPRKNTLRTIKALARIADEVPHHLVLVGGGDKSGLDALDSSTRSKVANRLHFLGYVPDDQLPALYTAASAYVHASLYEGFGLPLLEAMACGCPVITSNVYSLPEVAGDAALLVDATDVESIADAMLQICTDESVSDALVSKGNDRIKQFSWAECAAGVVDVYNEFL